MNEENTKNCSINIFPNEKLSDKINNTSCETLNVSKEKLDQENSPVYIIRNITIQSNNKFANLVVADLGLGENSAGLFNVNNNSILTFKLFCFIISNGDATPQMSVFMGDISSTISLEDCLLYRKDQKPNQDNNINVPIFSSSGKVSIINSTIKDIVLNTVVIKCNNIDLEGSTFENIKHISGITQDGTKYNSQSEGNSDSTNYTDFGSIASVMNGNLTINNCLFDTCGCENGFGGAFYFYFADSGEEFKLDDLSNSKTTFKNCYAYAGGVFFFECISDEINNNISNKTSFENNKADVGNDYFIVNKNLNTSFNPNDVSFVPTYEGESNKYNIFIIDFFDKAEDLVNSNLIVLRNNKNKEFISMVVLKSLDPDNYIGHLTGENITDVLRKNSPYCTSIYLDNGLLLNQSVLTLSDSKYSIFGDYKTKSDVFPLNCSFIIESESSFENIKFHFVDLYNYLEENNFMISNAPSLILRSVSFYGDTEYPVNLKESLILLNGTGYIYGCVFKSIFVNHEAAHVIHSLKDLIINGTSFIECTNGEGDGGGLYVEGEGHVLIGGSNTYTYFGGCKAVHGGGMYLYASSFESLCVSDITFGVGSEKNIAISGTNIYVISLLDRDINLYSFPILSHQVISKENLYCEVDGDNSYVYNYDKKEGNPFTFSGDLCGENGTIHPFIFSGYNISSQGKERRSNHLRKTIQNDDDRNLLDFFNEKLDQSHQSEFYIGSEGNDENSCTKNSNSCLTLNKTFYLGNYKNLKINVIDSVTIDHETIECYYCYILGNKEQKDGCNLIVNETSEIIIKGESKIESFNCYLDHFQRNVLFNIYSGNVNLVSLKIEPNETLTESYLFHPLIFVGYRGSLIIDKCSMKNFIGLSGCNGSAISARIEYDCSLEIKQSEIKNCSASDGYGGGLYASVNKGGKLILDKNSKGKTKFENCSSQKKNIEEENIGKAGRGGAIYINIGEKYSNVNIYISKDVIFGIEDESKNVGEGRDLFVCLPDENVNQSKVNEWFGNITDNNDFKQYCYNATKELNLYLCNLVTGNDNNVESSSSRNTHTKIFRETKSSFENPLHNSSLIPSEKNIRIEDVIGNTFFLSNIDDNDYINGESNDSDTSESNGNIKYKSVSSVVIDISSGEANSSLNSLHSNSSLISSERNITLKEDVARHTLLLSNQDNNVYVNGEGDGCTISENESIVCNCICAAVKNCTSGGTVILNPSGSSLSPELSQISIQNYNYTIESDTTSANIVELDVTEITDTNNDALDIFYITGGSLSVNNVKFCILVQTSSRYNANGDTISKSLFCVKGGSLSLTQCNVSGVEDSAGTSTTLSEPVILFKGSKLTLSGCTFKNLNLSGKDGSAINAAVANDNSLSFSGSISFTSCQAVNGGAIYLDYNGSSYNTYGSFAGSLTFTSCSAGKGKYLYIHVKNSNDASNLKESLKDYLFNTVLDRNQGIICCDGSDDLDLYTVRSRYVRSNGIDSNSGCTETDPCKSISHAFIQSLDEDSIEIMSDTSNPNIDANIEESSNTNVNKTITVKKSDATKGVNFAVKSMSSRALFLLDTNVTLSIKSIIFNISFVGCSDFYFISVTSGHLSLTSCSFNYNNNNNNNCSLVIFVNGISENNINECNFSNINDKSSVINVVSGSLSINGGYFSNITKINGNGSSISANANDGCSISINNVNFNNCTTLNGSGGAIYIDQKGGRVTVEGSSSSKIRFTNCCTDESNKDFRGGAIYIKINKGEPTLSYITFEGCKSYRGGNIYIVKSDVKNWVDRNLCGDKNVGKIITEGEDNETSAFGLNTDEGSFNNEFSVVSNKNIDKTLYVGENGTGEYCEGTDPELACRYLINVTSLEFNSNFDCVIIILNDSSQIGVIEFGSASSYNLTSNDKKNFNVNVTAETKFSISRKTIIQYLKFKFQSNPLSNPFIVSNDTLTLSSVDLTQSSLINIEDSLIKTSNSLNLSSVNISNITGSENGTVIQAIISNNCYVSISGCSFNSCKSVKNGGAIYVSFDGQGSLNIKGTIVNSSFYSCSASRGGAIFIDMKDQSSGLILESITFGNNNAGDSESKCPGNDYYIVAKNLSSMVDSLTSGTESAKVILNKETSLESAVGSEDSSSLQDIPLVAVGFPTLNDIYTNYSIDSSERYCGIKAYPCKSIEIGYNRVNNGKFVTIWNDSSPEPFILDPQQIIINKSATIKGYNGNNVILSVDSNSCTENSLFLLDSTNDGSSGSTLNIINITFSLTNSDILQFCIINMNTGTIKLSSCSFETKTGSSATRRLSNDNTLSYPTIIMSGGNMNIASCSFSNLSLNSEEPEGGAAIQAIISSGSSLSISNSSFTSCSTSSGYGGAIYAGVSGTGKLEIIGGDSSETSFTECSAGTGKTDGTVVDGGAIYIGLNGNNFNITVSSNVKFNSPTSPEFDYGGSDVYIHAETLTRKKAEKSFEFCQSSSDKMKIVVDDKKDSNVNLFDYIYPVKVNDADNRSISEANSESEAGGVLKIKKDNLDPETEQISINYTVTIQHENYSENNEKEVSLSVSDLGKDKALFDFSSGSSDKTLQINVFNFILTNSSVIEGLVFYVNKGNLSLYKCKFKREETDINEVDLGSEGSNLITSIILINYTGNGNLTRCAFEGLTFSGDSEFLNGGAIYAKLEGTSGTSHNYLKVFGCSFSGCGIERGLGGAIYVDISGYGELYVGNFTEDNEEDVEGGVVSNRLSNQETQTEFKKCSAGPSPKYIKRGAIYLNLDKKFGDLCIDGVEFNDNGNDLEESYDLFIENETKLCLYADVNFPYILKKDQDYLGATFKNSSVEDSIPLKSTLKNKPRLWSKENIIVCLIVIIVVLFIVAVIIILIIILCCSKRSNKKVEEKKESSDKVKNEELDDNLE